MYNKSNTTEASPHIGASSPLIPCMACIVLGVILGISLTIVGLEYHKKTSNTMLYGWRIAEWDSYFSACGDDAPEEFDFGEDTVDVTTISGSKFTSSYDLEPSEGSVSGYGKRITIHDYLGKEGCDISLDFGTHQPLAHLRIKQVGGDDRLDLFTDEHASEMSISYLSCG